MNMAMTSGMAANPLAYAQIITPVCIAGSECAHDYSKSVQQYPLT